MSNLFFEKPILNSPYDYPSQHWELDETGQPTQKIVEARRPAEFITPIPKPKKRKAKDAQAELNIGSDVSTEEQQYHSAIINGVRAEVDKWRSPFPRTQRLGRHARNRTPAAALAAPPLQRRAPVLLPSRGDRDRHLAD
jgi:hypothetical protein